MTRAYSLHTGILPKNLMALCRRHGSIASVCRELDMNRQQFNKYLTGTVLPAPATLEKICAFFDIVPQTLFDDPRMFRGKHDVGISQASLDIISNLPPKSLNLAAHAIDSMNTTTLRKDATRSTIRGRATFACACGRP